MKFFKLLITSVIMILSLTVFGQTISATDSRGITVQIDINTIFYSIKSPSPSGSILILADKSETFFTISNHAAIQTLGCNKFYSFTLAKKSGSLGIGDSVLLAIKYCRVQQSSTGGAVLTTTMKGITFYAQQGYSTIVAQGNTSCGGSGGGGTFVADLPVYLASGKSFGKYTNGQTVPAAGRTAIEVLTDVITEAISPTYTQPTITLNTPTAANYEIGSAINNTLTSTFIQNNAGSLITTVYQKNGVNLGSNTDNIASLTSQVCYQAVVTHTQGACLNNNLGAVDCTGRVNAGSIASASICLTPLPNKYYGFAASNSPSDANLRALTNVLSSSLGTLSTTFGAQSSTFLVYAYPASFPDLTTFNINGFESISSFTKTTRAVVNASGYSQSYKVYVSNNAFVTTGTTVIVAQ